MLYVLEEHQIYMYMYVCVSMWDVLPLGLIHIYPASL